MTLLPQAGEEMIPARHTSVLIFSASQAVSECLEMIQKLHIRPVPPAVLVAAHLSLGGCCSSSLGWAGLGEQCCWIRKPAPSGTWLLWGLRLFQVEAISVVVRGKCFLAESQTLIQPTVWLLSLFCLLLSKLRRKKTFLVCPSVSFSSKTFI